MKNLNFGLFISYFCANLNVQRCIVHLVVEEREISNSVFIYNIFSETKKYTIHNIQHTIHNMQYTQHICSQ
jgi:hypothetical protein